MKQKIPSCIRTQERIMATKYACSAGRTQLSQIHTQKFLELLNLQPNFSVCWLGNFLMDKVLCCSFAIGFVM